MKWGGVLVVTEAEAVLFNTCCHIRTLIHKAVARGCKQCQSGVAPTWSNDRVIFCMKGSSWRQVPCVFLRSRFRLTTNRHALIFTSSILMKWPLSHICAVSKSLWFVRVIFQKSFGNVVDELFQEVLCHFSATLFSHLSFKHVCDSNFMMCLWWQLCCTIELSLWFSVEWCHHHRSFSKWILKLFSEAALIPKVSSNSKIALET